MKFKRVLLILGILFPLISCEKDEFDASHPDVDKFVHLLRNNEYTGYELPDFTVDHIGQLLAFAGDTSQIALFPGNPISSKITQPKILGECLLWTIEGIRSERKYASLEPHLVETVTYRRLSGQEILQVSELYKDWWTEYKKAPSEILRQKDLLENTSYRWN